MRSSCTCILRLQLPRPLSLFIMSSTAEDNLCLSIESLEINQPEKLDHLLECYLSLLNQYADLRQQLSQNLSSVRFLLPLLLLPRFNPGQILMSQPKQGFLTLAQANFQSPNRARYGQDFYDDRMQASTLVYVSTDVLINQWCDS